MTKKVLIDETDLNNLIDLASSMSDVAMSSYYSTDITLQEESAALDKLINKLRGSRYE